VVIVVAAALAIELVEAATAIPVDNTIPNLCTWSSSGKTGMTNPTDLDRPPYARLLALRLFLDLL
jgi:hypothetical protein